MFAVIKTGGKQYKVQAGDIFEVEKLGGSTGEVVDFNEVLALGAGADFKVGAPLVEGASVAAEIVNQKKDDKVIIFKKKRRHNYRRKKGHRQEVTVVRVLEVLEAGKKRSVEPKKVESKKEAPAKAEAEAPKSKPAAKKAPAKKAPAKKAASKKEDQE